MNNANNITTLWDWSAQSRQPAPGVLVAQGQALAAKILTLASSFPADEPVDLHFIGFSRGADLNNVAIQTLATEEPPQLADGYVWETMLDPHPAQNLPFPRVSVGVVPFLSQFAEIALLSFQAIANDPPIVIPTNVDKVDDYMQTTDATTLLNTSVFEYVINLWGEVPPSNSVQPYVQNLTGPTIGHSEVPEWYVANVIPDLDEAPSPSFALARQPVSPDAGPSGPVSDLTVLYPAMVNDQSVAEALLADLTAVDSDYTKGDLVSMKADLNTLNSDLSAQSSHLTAQGAAFLVGTTQNLVTLAQNNEIDLPLSATSTGPFSTVADTPWTGEVAAFTDLDTKAAAGDFTASIDWGDGTTSVGVVASDGNGGFTVSGSHQFGNVGTFSANVSILDKGGSIATAVDSFTVMGAPKVAVFQAAANYPVGMSSAGNIRLPFAVATGDFNGDGKVDIIAATSNSDDGLVVLPGNGDGTFGSPIASAPGVSYTALAVGDFNGDGKPDIAALQPNGNTVTVLLGNGDGTFRTSFSYVVGQAPDSIVVGDFNGDGKPDIATANALDGTVSILLNRGDGTFGATTNYVTGSNPVGLIEGDFNGDGKPDLAVLDGGSIPSLSVLLNQGGGKFKVEPPISLASGTGAIAAGDIDGDGKLDIVGVGGAGVSILYGAGDGTFAAPVAYASLTYDGEIATADLGGDGRTEILASGPHDLIVLRGNGRGKPPTRTDHLVNAPLTTPTNEMIAVGDFNGDGQPDVVTADGESGDVTVLANLGGDLAAAAKVPVPNGAFGQLGTFTLVGDFNGDGKPDIATVSQNVETGAIRLDVLLGAGDGTFPTDVETNLSSMPDAMAAADFDGDGHLDLLLDSYSASTGTTITILYGNGDGSFGRSFGFTNPKVAYAVTTGDFNGDGKPDIAMTAVQVDPTTGDVFPPFNNDVDVYLNRGDGTFGAPLVVPNVGTDPRGLAAGDFNGDGKLDLVVANLHYGNGDPSDPMTVASTIDVLMGKGDGTFQAPVTYAGEGTFVAVGDFNGDGKPDFATINRVAGSSVSVYLNKGNGTFLPAVVSPAGLQVDSFATADFNGDGKLDVVVPTVYGDALLLGNGDGTFKAPTYLAIGDERVGTVGDFNGDGKPDIVSVADNTDLSLLENIAPSSNASVNFTIGADGQVYARALDGFGNPTGPYVLTSYGQVKDLAATRLGSGNTFETFVVGSDNRVYAQTVNSGGVGGGYFATAYGSVSSIAAGTDASGNPLLFAIGTDHQLYEQTFNASGQAASPSYTKAAYGDFKSTVLTHDVSGLPLLYAIGQDGQVYGLKMSATGTPNGGLFKMASGGVNQLVVSASSSGNPEIFVVGLDNYVYALKADPTGSPVGGYFGGIGGPVKSITVGTDSSHDPLLFAIGTDNKVYGHNFSATGAPTGGFYSTTAGSATSIVAGVGANGNPEVFAVLSTDGQVYAAPFDPTGKSTGTFTLTTAGVVKMVVVV